VTNTELVVGIDIGGTGIKGAPVDMHAGQLAAERIRLLTPSPSTPEAVADVTSLVVEQLGVPGPLGITIPAVVRDGVVETASNIDPAWIGTDAATLFTKVTGRPVGVVNDADAAGIAEMRFGAGRDTHGVVLLLTLGTGIGSALFVDGTLVPNTELGHLHLPHHGLAEKYASELVRENEDLSWKHYAERLHTYFEEVEKLFWPTLIIIGGGISKKAEKYLPHVSVRTPIVPAELKNDAGIVGAALFAPSV
jgi:polyphosphate glucokinase